MAGGVLFRLGGVYPLLGVVPLLLFRSGVLDPLFHRMAGCRSFRLLSGRVAGSRRSGLAGLRLLSNRLGRSIPPRDGVTPSLEGCTPSRVGRRTPSRDGWTPLRDWSTLDGLRSASVIRPRGAIPLPPTLELKLPPLKPVLGPV